MVPVTLAMHSTLMATKSADSIEQQRARQNEARALDVTSVFVAARTRDAAASLEDERGWRGHLNSDDPA
jgi:hypothetical protein